ncbi:prefoldin subunit 5 [Rhinolophus ferrumequinum]|uniref:Prefoldin subunit 5 n=1 Tax=Rhinolophus ferrumequinum TaxID=59479 RepID=A0A7J7WSC2_RHIFE|nr:prefoldin subunit 5 [Rhinolophus ferrumequinum]
MYCSVSPLHVTYPELKCTGHSSALAARFCSFHTICAVPYRNSLQPLKVGAANLPQMFVLIVFTGKELLVPLTSSMYVPGKLHDVEHVLIDVGTGYYVEKTAEDAKDFFKRKIDFLTKQMEKIQPALQEKHAMKQGKLAVMEMMSQKIQQLTALGVTQAAKA